MMISTIILESHHTGNESYDGVYRRSQDSQLTSSKTSHSSVTSDESSFCHSSINRQDLVSEIDYVCRLLAISADPYNWNQTDVRKWLIYHQRLFQINIPTIEEFLDSFRMDGISLCELTLQDFHHRICRSKNTFAMNCNCSHSNEFHLVKMIHNELGVWRNAIETIEPDLAFLDSEQTNSQGPIQSTTLRLSSASYNNNNDAQQHHSQSKTSSNLYLSPVSPVSSYENGQHHFIPDQSGNNPLTNDVEYLHPRSFVDDRPSMCSMYSPSSSPSLLSSSPCSPAGSNHSIPISSIHSNYGPNTQCSFVHVPFIHQHNNNQFPQQQQQHPDQQSQFNSRISFGNNNPISYAESDFFDFSNNNFLQRQIQETPINTVRNHCLYSDCGSDGGGNFSDDDLMNEESEDFWKNPCKTDRSVSYSSTMRKFHDRTSSHQDPFSLHSIESSSMTRNNGSSSSSIQLWQFLKELLSQPQKHGTAIRWIERSSGVFKIEDSVRVARLWGERKNRPAMNYDKLSRSIRQYYKKGIMKKTERAQRLVYQFCKPYSL